MKDINSWNWFGVLTIENLKDVAQVAFKMLESKKYTFASCIESLDHMDVRPDQSLENGTNGSPLSVWHDEIGDKYGGFNFCDTYGVWGLSTSARDGQPFDNYNTPYISFEYDKTIRITQRNGYGNIIKWVIVVQRSEKGE